MRQMAGQRAQIAIGRDDFGEAGDLTGGGRHAAHAGIICQQIGDGVFAFVGFQRAGSIDEHSAWLQHGHGLGQQTALQGGQHGDVGFLFQPGDIGMATNGAGG